MDHRVPLSVLLSSFDFVVGVVSRDVNCCSPKAGNLAGAVIAAAQLNSNIISNLVPLLIHVLRLCYPDIVLASLVSYSNGHRRAQCLEANRGLLRVGNPLATYQHPSLAVLYRV